MSGKNMIKTLRVMRAMNGVALIVNATFAVVLAFTGHSAALSAGVVVFIALVMCFQTFVIRRQRRIDAIADRPRPDYAAIARLEREIYGEAVPDVRPPSPLCPCGGTLPQHIRSPHYMAGYDAAGTITSHAQIISTAHLAGTGTFIATQIADDLAVNALRGAIVRPGGSIIMPSGQRIDSAEWARRGGRTS